MIFDADQEAVLADQSPRMLIEAPPGSGKTMTAARLVARDIQAGRLGPTQRALILTFSRNARSQLERYAGEVLTAPERGLVEITNYHSWFWMKVSQFHMSLGLPLLIELASETQRASDVHAAMEAEGVAPIVRGRDRNVDDYSNVLEYSLPQGRPERLAAPLPKGAEIGNLLVQRHRLSGLLHYDDLAYYTWLMVDGSRTLRHLWRHKYPVIVLDEYQDSSPLQAEIIRRLAGDEHRVYAFADPLQQIYTWRDASKKRLEEFRAQQPSEHSLRTLHRYRHRPALQAWMQEARDVLLDEGASVGVPLPPEITVVRYDPSQPERGKVWGAEARELFQLDAPISAAFRDSAINTIAVLARRRNQLAVLERRLAEKFRCGRLRASEEGLDCARDWIDGYAKAVTPEHHAMRLLSLAQRVAPRHSYLDLEERIGVDGFEEARLRKPRREIVQGINALIPECNSLSGAFRAAQGVLRIACKDQDPRVVDWDTLYSLRRALHAPADLPDEETAERARRRIQQARFSSAATPRRGLYLLSCHEGKGKEFDLVILPHVSTANFGDDEESRQLLYVSLSRARHRLLIRLASGQVPPICERLGLT